MLDDLHRMLGGDGPIAVFIGDAVTCECCRREGGDVFDLSEAGLATGVVACWTAGNWARRWGCHGLPEAGHAAGAVMLHQRPALLLGWLCFAGYRLCRMDDCSSLGIPRSRDEGLEL
ncbi:hypothetical protein CRG98_008779 [Punica granatum]|uniref:Uncharacterized protein n=1 Tax=Punica granatum TaxID=22663 RepID=A0A2I0KQV9_PUNGR|nr:hypothetical protein CRG98_008779 [Punica granatum]